MRSSCRGQRWSQLRAAARLRKMFRTLRRPLVAIPVYVALLYGWHMAFMFEGAL